MPRRCGDCRNMDVPLRLPLRPLCKPGDDWVDDWVMEVERGGLDSVASVGEGEDVAPFMVLVDLDELLLDAADLERLD